MNKLGDIITVLALVYLMYLGVTEFIMKEMTQGAYIKMFWPNMLIAVVVAVAGMALKRKKKGK